jgi:hypothetical protein
VGGSSRGPLARGKGDYAQAGAGNTGMSNEDRKEVQVGVGGDECVGGRRKREQ